MKRASIAMTTLMPRVSGGTHTNTHTAAVALLGAAAIQWNLSVASRERGKELRVSMTTLKRLEREAKWTSVILVSTTTHLQLLGKVCTYVRM